MSLETSQELASLAQKVEELQSRLSAKSILKLSQSDRITTEDIESLYRKEVRLSDINPIVALYIHATRVHLAQPFSNSFYKDPETGFGDKGEDEE